MTPTDSIVVPIAILGTAVLGAITTSIRLWSDVQAMKEKVEGLEAECKKVAGHETEIALLKAAVTDLKAIPDKLDRLYDLVRSRA